MTDIRIEALKGMNSSVIKGMGDSPLALTNVIFRRDGGYAVAPSGTQRILGARVFKQFSVRRYAFLQEAGGAYLYDLKNFTKTLYSGAGGTILKDAVAYGSYVITSGNYVGAGVTGGPLTPNSLSGEVSDGEPTGGPDTLETRAYGLDLTSFPLIAPVTYMVKYVPAFAPGNAVKAAAAGDPTYRYDNETYLGFNVGSWHLITVYFRRKAGRVGTVLNPTEAKPLYLANHLTLLLPAYPTDAAAAPIYGQYHPAFTFTGIPEDYEPVIFGFSGPATPGTPTAANKIPSQGTDIVLHDVITVQTNGSFGLWQATGAGTLASWPNLPGTNYELGAEVSFSGIPFRFIGYQYTDYGYGAGSGGTYFVDESQMFNYLQAQGLDAPLFLMADYINRARPGPLPQNGNTPRHRWGRLNVIQTGAEYRVTRSAHRNAELNPDRATFFPIGSRSAESNGVVWVAADYVIRNTFTPSVVNNRTATFNISPMVREWAKAGRMRTVYYSQPYSLDFGEDFVIPPLPRSATITAVEATLSGVIVFGEADACLISGDSPASFRATSLNIPGTISQETVATLNGVTYYANADGLYMLNGGQAQLLSEPVADIWRIAPPSSISVNTREGTLLISMLATHTMHYDTLRNAWSSWSVNQVIGTSGFAMPFAHASHILATPTGTIYTMDALSLATAEAVFLVDGASPGTRKTFTKASYKAEREISGATELYYRASEAEEWRKSSSTTDGDLATMMHRLSAHGNALYVRLSFKNASVGGPLTIGVDMVDDAADIGRN